MFFDATADFIDATPWLSRTLVTSNDDVILDKAAARRFEAIRRPAELAGPDTSIHATFEHLLSVADVASDAVLWLFYLPVVYKDAADFEIARRMMEDGGCDSLIGLCPALSHPYSCWRLDEGGRMRQYVQNDVFRRQDMPDAWTHHHYLCAFRRRTFESLNSELIGPATCPVKIPARTIERLIEVDTYEDLDRWKRAQAAHK